MEFSWTLIHGLMRAGGLAGDERPTIRSRAACALCAFGRDLWTHGDAVDALMTEYRSIDGWWGARVARRGGAPLMDDASFRGMTDSGKRCTTNTRAAAWHARTVAPTLTCGGDPWTHICPHRRAA